MENTQFNRHRTFSLFMYIKLFTGRRSNTRSLDSDEYYRIKGIVKLGNNHNFRDKMIGDLHFVPV